jgi:hypothetical protein
LPFLVSPTACSLFWLVHSCHPEKTDPTPIVPVHPAS